MSKPIRYCNYCYIQEDNNTKFSLCSICHETTYCSRHCQRLNWKQHKLWCCCNVGILNVDFEVREVDKKGLGVFAKRSFLKGDKIMVERPVFSTRENSGPLDWENNYMQLPNSIKAAINALHKVSVDHYSRALRLPTHSLDFFRYNQHHLAIMSNKFSDGLFITVSRMNHSCLGNCEVSFLDDHNVGVVSALTDIAVGEELCYSYIEIGRDIIDDPDMIYKKWNFQCLCPRCTDDTIHNKIICLVNIETELKKLHTLIGVNPSSVTYEDDNRGYHLGEQIIRICDELACCPRKHIYDTYIRMSINAVRMGQFDVAIECLDKAIVSYDESLGGSKATPKWIQEKQSTRDLILAHISEMGLEK